MRSTPNILLNIFEIFNREKIQNRGSWWADKQRVHLKRLVGVSNATEWGTEKYIHIIIGYEFYVFG